MQNKISEINKELSICKEINQKAENEKISIYNLLNNERNQKKELIQKLEEISKTYKIKYLLI